MKSTSYRSLDWHGGLTVAAMRDYLRELKDDDLISPLLFKGHVPIKRPEGGVSQPGFRARDGKADCCETNPVPATVHAIEHSLAGDRIEVSVTASHPCGIQKISIFLGAYLLLPNPAHPGGRVRQPRVRDKPDGSLYEETWTRDDSHDGDPVTLTVVFPKDALIPIWNCWIIGITDRCGRETQGHTGEFDIPS